VQVGLVFIVEFIVALIVSLCDESVLQVRVAEQLDPLDAQL
jgi:hypothetical protein